MSSSSPARMPRPNGGDGPLHQNTALAHSNAVCGADFADQPRDRKVSRFGDFAIPGLGISKTRGPWTLELATAATFFSENDDFLGGKTREQDPIYSVKGGLIYGFRNGIWVALNGTYFTGGWHRVAISLGRRALAVGAL